MSHIEMNLYAPDGVPPQGRHIKIDCFTVTNTSYPPTPGMPQLAPPGSGYNTFISRATDPICCPLFYFSFTPPPPPFPSSSP